jgi:predicted metal-dependent hydrolase
MSPPSGSSAPVSYTVTRSRRRSLELRVFPDHRIEVRAPLRTRDQDIAEFVDSRRDWLQRTLTQLAERPPPLQLALVDGARHPFLGRPVTLRLAQGPSGAVLRQDELFITATSPERAAALLDRWYREQARQHYEAEIDRHFPFFAARGHTRPVLRIKQMKSRWGSLSRRGYINLNLALIRLPMPCLEYVVVHELCHLEQMNHGPQFHALMDQRLPDWRARRQLLNRLPAIELTF